MREKTLTSFRVALRRARITARLTQEVLAERSGLGVRSIQGLERGETQPRGDTVRRLVKALRLTGEQAAAFEDAGQTVPRQRSTDSLVADTARSDGRAETPARHNLPSQFTSFVGRQREIVDLTHLLAAHRLVTLTGTGGCGKTRLVLEVAGDLIDHFVDGVWLVELAPIPDLSLIPQAVAEVLRVREVGGQTILAALTSYLRSRHSLLILDNCEHVIEPVARLADTLLKACPGLTVLATSREALGIGGEVAWPVPPLPTPPRDQVFSHAELARYDAVRLFVDRARAVDPVFALSAANVAAVTQICGRLDGIPLAIELVAARLRGMTVERVAARLDDQFRLLTGGSRTALPHQQTLRATIDWSYTLLDVPERRMLRRLAVFHGGCPLVAAEAIGAGEGIAAEDVLDLLSQLVGKSLLVLDKEAGDERYRLLETMRQYARDCLVASGEATAIRDRHRDWYLRFTEEAADGILGPQQAAWFRRLDREYDNVRAALGWAIEQAAAPVALRFGSALVNYWQARGHYAEGVDRMDRILALPPGATSDTPRDVNVLRVRALNAASSMHWFRGDRATSRALGEEYLALARAINDRPGIAAGLTDLGLHSAFSGEHQTARSQFEEAVALRRELADTWGLAMTLQGQGSATLRAFEDAASARPILVESVARYRQAGDRWSSSWPLGMLGWVDVELGTHAEARAELAESLAILRDVRDETFVPVLIEGFARLAAAEGMPRRALRLTRAAESLRAGIGIPPRVDWMSRSLASLLKVARQALGSEIDVAEDEGRAMTMEQAIAYALEEDNR